MTSIIVPASTDSIQAYSVADYDAFLASKRIEIPSVGFQVEPDTLHPNFYPFQRRIVQWAISRGRAALFEDCGLGKGPQQLEWSRQVHQYTDGNVLIAAPLAVSFQLVREGEKFGIPVHRCDQKSDVRAGINVTNYDRLTNFDPADFAAIVAEESSILKAFSGTMRREITDFASEILYRLACTATPAPNDLIEIINHAEFLGIMSGKEIIALFFTQDGNTTHSWRLKGHAREAFWQWVRTWAIAIRKPSDIGYDDGPFVLPPLTMHQLTVDAEASSTRLFAVEAQTLQERQEARRDSIPQRVEACASLVNASEEPWIVWCNLNAESEALRKSIRGAVEVSGGDAPEHKERAMLDFAEGRIRVLVTKPSIAGFGMNWQHCRNVAFVGLSDSFEQYYQAIRRCWRFGQTREVHCHIITAQTEGAVVANIERKEQQANEMMQSIVSDMGSLSEGAAQREEMSITTASVAGKKWRMLLGDSVTRIDEIETDSCGLGVFSPPFPGMYAYTNSKNDIGNCSTIDEMLEHFGYLVGPDKLMRILMPGRLCCVHLTQLTAMKSREGYIGLHDYRGRLIEMMIRKGWIFHGEVTIDKNPQVQAVRNKERGLMFKSLATDSSVMRMALADYLIYFRKPGENPEPIRAGISKKYNNPEGWISEQEWIEWASPVWYRHTKGMPGGIRETDVLNVAQARDTDDERHLCPLQLGVIERAVKLWSNPGDIVFSPFAGVGSELYGAVKYGRRGLGIELKESYFQSAVRNLQQLENEAHTGSLLDLMQEDDDLAKAIAA